MQEGVLESGWIYGQCKLLGKQNKYWMVLSPNSLTTYNRSDNSTLTNRLLLSEIKGIEKISASKFQVKTSSESLVFSSETSSEKWIQAIENQVRNPLRTSETTLKYHFVNLKEAMKSREIDLQMKNEGEHFTLLEKARVELETATDHLWRMQENLSKLRSFNSQSLFDKLSHLLSMKEAFTSTELDAPECNSKVNLKLNTGLVNGFVSRFTTISVVNPNELIARRSGITRALKWRYTGDKSDAISFVLTHDVLLTGVGICRPYKAGRPLHISKFMILRGKRTDSKPIYSHVRNSFVEFKQDESVQQIKLNQPLKLAKNLHYTAYFLINGDASFKCVDCSATCEVGNVGWKFVNTEFTPGYQTNRTDSVCGPIANFQFQKIN